MDGKASDEKFSTGIWNQRTAGIPQNERRMAAGIPKTR
jgi:hypothetical protein